MDETEMYRLLGVVVCITAFCASPKYGLWTGVGVLVALLYHEITMTRLYTDYDRQAVDYMFGLQSKIVNEETLDDSVKEGATHPNRFKKTKQEEDVDEDEEEKAVDKANSKLTRGIRKYEPTETIRDFRLNVRPAYMRKPRETVENGRRDDRKWMEFCNTRVTSYEELPEELKFAPVQR